MLGYERTITRTNNWPFPRPLYQNEVKCPAFDMEMIFHSHANKSHFHKKSCALGLILRVRVFGLLQCDYNNQGQLTIISTWSDVISLNCWRLDFHLVKCLSNCQFLLRITRFFTKSCDSRSIMRNRSIAECQKPCIRGWATWCYSRHLSKLGNCFDEWTTGSNRQRRIMNPYRSPHRTDNTQTTSSSQTELRELLKILAVLPMESMEVERSFYSIRRILTYLASENNGHRTTFIFGRHRHVWR